MLVSVLMLCVIPALVYSGKTEAETVRVKYDFGKINKYKSYILRYSKKHNIDPYVLAGVIIQEGCYDGCYSKRYGYNRGNSGEYGILQIMPYHVKKPHRLKNTDYNFEVGSKYLSLMIKQKGLVRGISSYNRGPNGKFNHRYVKNVLTYKQNLERGIPVND